MSIPKRSLYDCLHAKFIPDMSGDDRDARVLCANGHPLLNGPRDGGIPALAVIVGRRLCLSTCQSCPDFDQMDGGPVKPEDRGWVDIYKARKEGGEVICR